MFGLKSHQIETDGIIPYMHVYKITAAMASVSRSTLRGMADFFIYLFTAEANEVMGMISKQ